MVNIDFGYRTKCDNVFMLLKCLESGFIAANVSEILLKFEKANFNSLTGMGVQFVNRDVPVVIQQLLENRSMRVHAV